MGRLFPALHGLSPLEPAQEGSAAAEAAGDTPAQTGWESRGQTQQFTLSRTQCFGQTECVASAAS